VRERGVGRRLGFPTVNIKVLDEKMMPPYGVYSGLLATDGGKVYWGVANWGLAPTFGRNTPRLEVHVLREAFNEEPGRALFVFHKFIRHEKKFGSVYELVRQVDKDLDMAMRMYSEEFVKSFYRAFLPSRVWKCMEEMRIG
jgi:riboflavin kinase/FMN adenylyltransferase